jgi:DNA repair protein RadC
MTKKLTASSRILDLFVLDHLIISRKCYYSFADEGLI